MSEVRVREERSAREGVDHTALVAELCKLLEGERPPALAALAAHAGLSPFHVHRIFQRATGLTPRAYAAAHRAERTRSSLREAPSVAQAIYGAGYVSTGRFYGDASARLGMTPSSYRAGGEGVELEWAVGRSTLGEVLVAATARGVCAILLGDSREALVRELEERFPRARCAPAATDFARLVEDVVQLVEEPGAGLALPLDVRGTAFQERVWRALRAIPAGETRSYAELAAAIGSPRSTRAVGRACATNPVAIAIPCHRAVGKDGALHGYRWGLERKAALLAREKKTKP